jgi:hypothetical protein
VGAAVRRRVGLRVGRSDHVAQIRQDHRVNPARISRTVHVPATEACHTALQWGDSPNRSRGGIVSVASVMLRVAGSWSRWQLGQGRPVVGDDLWRCSRSCITSTAQC